MKDKKTVKLIDKITQVFTWISSVLLVALVILIIVNVVGRKLFNAPVSGAVELIEFGMLFVMALAISRTGFEGRQLAVTLIHEKLPAKARGILVFVCQLIATVTFGSLFVSYALKLPESLKSTRVSDVLHIPYIVVNVLLVVAMFMVAVTFLYQAIVGLYKGFHPEQKEEKSAEELQQEGGGL